MLATPSSQTGRRARRSSSQTSKPAVSMLLAPMRWHTEAVAVQMLAATASRIAVPIVPCFTSSAAQHPDGWNSIGISAIPLVRFGVHASFAPGKYAAWRVNVSVPSLIVTNMNQFALSVVGALAGVVCAVASIVPLLRRRRRRQQVSATSGGGAPVAGTGEDELVVVGDIPYEPPSFQLRADLLAELDVLPSGRGPVPTVHAVTGMRGVGKTQLAAAYVRARLADRWRLVAWINAGDSASLRGGLAAVAARLGLDGGTGDVEEAGQAVRHWLETDGDRCLLVFDNVADPQDLLSFIPVAGHATVLITSNDQSMVYLGISVAVNVFTVEEALEFLVGRIGSADTEDAALLASELGYLPLALAQAAAVIADRRLDYQTYLERLRTMPMDSLLPPISPSTYPHGLAAAVLLSLEAVRAVDDTGRLHRGDGSGIGAVGRRSVP